MSPPKDAYECLCCGECCHGQGGIRITEEEAQLQAVYLGIRPEKYLDKYTILRNGNREIGIREDGACHFLKDKICSIHPVKPAICRLWPWLPGALAEEVGFIGLKGGCAGIDPEATWEEFKAQAERIQKEDQGD